MSALVVLGARQQQLHEANGSLDHVLRVLRRIRGVARTHRPPAGPAYIEAETMDHAQGGVEEMARVGVVHGST